MARLFVPRASIREGAVEIAGEELRHLRTLRLGAGDLLVVFDDTGIEHTVRLERVDRRAARGVIERSEAVSRESPLAVTLLPALLKGPRMDVVIEKATELGVIRIAPVLTARCVAERGHVARWRRIALAAAKQCGRTRTPAIDEPVPLAVRLDSFGNGLRLIAWEEATAPGWDRLPAVATAVTVLLGPEGGFTLDEVVQARAAGFHAVSLGGRVLRGDTAAIVAVALCQHRWGDG
ncbi:MAG TPA: 16S rRNA (uracil(1498)-N(3))-methyltransferase [Candidatus Limnocylindria bacterium]|nr:16S rRNA (uracil(1498)-N(3))-methyltransferase [Candidatus Limnocylindria bacterium]